MNIIRKNRKALDLDVTPLIDVIFQLLVFFMLTSSFLQPAMKLNLPKAVTNDDKLNQELVLSISQEGDFYLEKQKIIPTDLKTVLRAKLHGKKEKAITIRGDENVAYKFFVQAMDQSRQAGASIINLIHDGK